MHTFILTAMSTNKVPALTNSVFPLSLDLYLEYHAVIKPGVSNINILIRGNNEKTIHSMTRYLADLHTSSTAFCTPLLKYFLKTQST